MSRHGQQGSEQLYLGIEASANKCAVGVVRSDGTILSNPRKTCVPPPPCEPLCGSRSLSLTRPHAWQVYHAARDWLPAA